jgi:drug/metabolite transporter (DMT)-like permease
MTQTRHYRLGLFLVTLSAVAWSTAGFFTRLIALDIWTLLLWRGIFGALGIFVFMSVYQGAGSRSAFRQMGVAGWLFALVGAVGMLCFIGSLKLTSVAHASVIYATAPLITAALAWAVMRERASRSAILASLVALVGVAVMVGLGHEGTLAGDLLALGMTVCMAILMIISRRYQGIPMLAAAGLSAVVSVLVVLPFAQWALPGSTVLWQLAMFGLLNSAVGLALFAIGSKMLPTTETALIGALDAPLAPIWVMLAFGEIPSLATLVGGAIVFLAIFSHVFFASVRKTGS